MATTQPASFALAAIGPIIRAGRAASSSAATSVKPGMRWSGGNRIRKSPSIFAIADTELSLHYSPSARSPAAA